MPSATILVVDDEPQIRALLRRVLWAQGYQVLLAEDAETALGHLAGEDPIDLLLTDMVMPGLSGRVLLERAMKMRPGLPMILMSGYAEYADTRYVVSELKVPFLPKPFTREELDVTLRAALARPGSSVQGSTINVRR